MFLWKWTKRAIVGGALCAAIVGVVYVSGASSYVVSSSRMIQTAVKDSIPTEFELQRARDMLDDLVPELRANVRVVAAEDVAVANLEKEIASESTRIETERGKVLSLRDALRQQQVSYRFGGIDYEREEVVNELERRFDNLRTAEKMLDSRQELLSNRRRSLNAAINKLEKTRVARVQLAAEIEALEAQFRLIEAQSTESQFTLDDSKLAQTQKLIGELKNRLQVAQNVMAREARLIEFIPVEEVVSESTVVGRIDSYFEGDSGSEPDGVASASTSSL